MPLSLDPKPTISRSPPRPLTVGVWVVALAALGAGGLLASGFALMAASLDPAEIVAAGAEPWTNAAMAVGAFSLLVVATVLGLLSWHSSRFRAVGLAITAAEAGAVAWACLRFYNEYL